ncbi:MAG: Stk1 family PASTA domain-containing Ser/Thr kinase [Bacilli bacterium]|nr:Stk1 family PASTA domain-containing Ser/Thr kinase [Bacilli bacterium]
MMEKGYKLNDRYEIIKSIGEGGMANVYLAFDVILDRKVAVKVLRGDLSNDEKFVRRFQREALSASSLTHPNIVEMYDVGESDGTYYIVMEYVEGKTLKQLIKKRGSITLSEAIDIMLQITDGITQAHDSYIIHRDLKPQNILIKEDGAIKITDFGIAMALNSTQLTQTNSVMGSVHYLPPEQASGKGSTIRSDIYSMGILFYELLIGTLPFRGDNAVEIALKQMRDPIPSICKQNPSVPQSVENIVLKATAKNPKNRYADVREMHEDLLTALNDDKINEPRYIYKYPEHDQDDETKVIPVIKQKKPGRVDRNKDKEEDVSLEEMPIAKQIEDDLKKDKKISKPVIILTSILGFFVVVLLFIFLLLPYLTRIPDVEVPDVSKMTVVEAEKKLKELGFEVALEVKKEESSDIEKGKVIKTSPTKGRSIKKGSTITIYESLGLDTYEIEDYSGENYIEIKTLLENVHGLKVTIEEKDVETTSNYGEQEIIDQSVLAGEKLTKGDEIILYIPKAIEGYPDMVSEGWTLEEAQAFCNKYEITLTVAYQETSQYTPGMVVLQSREAKSPVVKGSTLKVTIAKEPESTDSVNDGKPAVDVE